MRQKLALVVILTLACAASLPAQVMHPDLKSGKKQIRSIVLMPVVVDVTKLSLKGTESMHEEARDTELPLTLEVAAVLHDLGYQLDVETLSNETLVKDTEQRTAVDDLQRQYDAQLHLLHRKSKGVRQGRFTLGDDLVKLPLGDGVDALLFVRTRGEVLTENKKTLSAFSYNSTNDTTLMDFGMVDARTGDVLYFAKSKISANIMKDSEEISSGIARAFVDMPKSKSPAPVVDQKVQSAATTGSDPATGSGRLTQPTTAPLAAADVSSSRLQTRRIRLSHRVLQGMLIEKVTPDYPGIASMNHVEGEVVVRIVIDRNGRISEAKALSGPVQLIAAATSAVKQWRYHPFVVKGQPFEVETNIVLTFKLDGSRSE